MNVDQAAIAIKELEKNGHLFSLKSDGSMAVTNVTPQIMKFCQNWSAVLKEALSIRNQHREARKCFPESTTVGRYTWEEIKATWDGWTHTLPEEEQLEVMSRVIARLHSQIGQQDAIRFFEWMATGRKS